ncbi:MAG: hypothetical protein DWH91_02495 [Planctomycetota bacterium]|nr:MAG: hypothetical protein DWH91_02495 [Planctomycetota bacterium]
MNTEAAADKAQEGSHQLAITRPDRPSPQMPDDLSRALTLHFTSPAQRPRAPPPLTSQNPYPDPHDKHKTIRNPT